MRRLIITISVVGLALTALAGCDSDAPEPECIQCCNCLCTDSTIPIDTSDPTDCIDCVDRCVSMICSQYGGGGGEGSEPCD